MNEGIGIVLAQLCSAFRNRIDADVRAHGLYVGQEHALMCLWDEDGQTQTQLGECMGCTPATVSNMVARLEASGLVERRRSRTDARVAQVFLTDAGRALHEPITQLWTRAENDMMLRMTPEERLLLRRLLLQALDNLQG